MEYWAQAMFRNLHESCLKLKYIFFADYHFRNHPPQLSDLAKVKTLQKIWILEGVDPSSLSTRDLSEATSEQHKEILKKVSIYPPPR